ncbi:hypothetical protein [Fodinibius sp.]|uniref:hypothetical protein n=1 Tax=Fodinibius sp. TaxID=1872440 RepID=UPI002ACD4191|nr:hypothetical protein [Fodinibius sp.]MDZ7660056.1 hypothetical protein [Fodinibius sp.]
MKKEHPNKDNTVITFTALEYESGRDEKLADLIGEHNPPTEEVQISLKLEEVKEYKQSKFKGLTELVTEGGDTYIIDEEWAQFDWRYKYETGQHPEETWKVHRSLNGLVKIRTYHN